MTRGGVTGVDTARLEAIRQRANELATLGMGRSQAQYQALEEAWKDEVSENERLWDQADEIERLKRYVSIVASGLPREQLLEIERQVVRLTDEPAPLSEPDDPQGPSGAQNAATPPAIRKDAGASGSLSGADEPAKPEEAQSPTDRATCAPDVREGT